MQAVTENKPLSGPTSTCRGPSGQQVLPMAQSFLGIFMVMEAGNGGLARVVQADSTTRVVLSVHMAVGSAMGV